MAFSQTLFAEDVNTSSAPVGLPEFSLQQEAFISFGAAKPDDHREKAGHLFTSAQASVRDCWFQKNIAKYKKKYKRINSSPTRLERPVRDVENAPVNIFTKDLYSKPHFLSHLHRFLFRLTPF